MCDIDGGDLGGLDSGGLDLGGGFDSFDSGESFDAFDGLDSGSAFDSSDGFDLGSSFDSSDGFDLGDSFGSSEGMDFGSDIDTSTELGSDEGIFDDPAESLSLDETEDIPFESAEDIGTESFDSFDGLEDPLSDEIAGVDDTDLGGDIPEDIDSDISDFDSTDEVLDEAEELPFETDESIPLDEAEDIPFEQDESIPLDETEVLPFEDVEQEAMDSIDQVEEPLSDEITSFDDTSSDEIDVGDETVIPEYIESGADILPSDDINIADDIEVSESVESVDDIALPDETEAVDDSVEAPEEMSETEPDIPVDTEDSGVELADSFDEAGESVTGEELGFDDAPAELTDTGYPAIDDIMNSDMSNTEKLDSLKAMKDELQNPEVPDEISEDGVPVKVLKYGGGDASLSYPDYERDLADLDEGIQNAREPFDEMTNNVLEDNERILNDDFLSPSEKIAALEDSKDKLRAIDDTWKDESKDWYDQRADLVDKLGADQPEFDSPEIPADTLEAAPEIAETGADSFQMVNPNDVDMSDELGMDDPNFWNHHGNTKEDYMDLAGKLPEVQERLDNGESLDDLYQDPDVGDTARQYYHPDHMIKLEEDPDGNLVSTGDGRHRLRAAQELGYDVPVDMNHAVGEPLEAAQDLAGDVPADMNDTFSEPLEVPPEMAGEVPDWDRTALTPSEEKLIHEMDDNGEIDIPHVNPDLAEPEPGKLHLPKDTGEFLCERGDSAFVPNDQNVLDKMKGYGQDHIDYVGGHPDFSPFTKQETPWGPVDCQVEIGHMTDQRENPSWEFGRRPAGTSHDPNYDLGNFAQADNALLEKFREVNPDATMKDVEDFINNNNLTWHECADGKTMQLVPTDIHDACRHSGGVSDMKYRMAMGDVELPDE